MLSCRNVLNRLNRWFDALPEPKRTLYFFGGAAVVIGLVSFEATAIPGGILLLLVSIWALTRL